MEVPQKYQEEIQSENEFNKGLQMIQSFNEMDVSPTRKWIKIIQISSTDLLNVQLYKILVQLTMNTIIPFGYSTRHYKIKRTSVLVNNKFILSSETSKYVFYAGFFHAVDKYLFRACVCNLLYLFSKFSKNSSDMNLIAHQYFTFWINLPFFIKKKDETTLTNNRFNNLFECEVAGKFIYSMFNILFASSVKLESYDEYEFIINYDKVVIKNNFKSTEYPMHLCHFKHANNLLSMR